jgi:amino acid transporter
MAGVPFAMLFVLFTYSGWNEAAYISAELKERRSMVVALSVSIGLVTLLYLAVNYAYVRGLGFQGVAKSETVAADLMKVQFGAVGAQMMSAVVCLAALTSINATIIAGARSNYALGRDFPIFRWLGHWEARTDAPRNSLYVQGAVALVLVVAGAFTDQVKTMIEYTSPVFWFFFMLVGIGLIVLRARDPGTPRPFKVPLYPLTPVIFILTCAYLFYSSVAYVKGGAWAGVGVLAVGVVLLAISLQRAPQAGRP